MARVSAAFLYLEVANTRPFFTIICARHCLMAGTGIISAVYIMRSF